mgnify:CR=1 FL=1
MTDAHLRSTHVRARRALTGVAAAALLALTASPALSQVEVPTRSGVGSAAAQPAAAPPAQAAPSVGAAGTVAPSAPTPVTTVLRPGSRGAAVRALQRALVARGLRVAVDGDYGPGTRKAVRAIQRRMKLRVTGIADARLLKRLKVTIRTVASATPAAPAVQGGGLLQVFPLIGDYSYFDDYGAPRHQGAHEGTDIMADRGTPIVAVVDGVTKRVQRTESGLGGIYIWLQRADGMEYYYAHMSAIASDIQIGSRVRAGQLIGFVGNTGDARYGATHLHFEIRKGGTVTVPPYTHLVAVDPTHATSAARAR